MPDGTVNDWGQSVYVAFTTAFTSLVNALPAIIGALLVLAIGWWIAGILGRLATRLLARAGADRLYAEHGGQVYGQAATQIEPSRVAGEVVKWVIRVIALVAAANLLGLTQISQLLNQIILWIPNLIVAAVILLVAPLIGRFLRGAIEVGAGQMGFTNAPLLGRIAEIAVIAFAVLIAIDQIGIASDLLNILFTGIVAALALAFGISFGLGGRDVAAQVTQRWYDQSQEAASRVREASGGAGTGTGMGTETAGTGMGTETAGTGMGTGTRGVAGGIGASGGMGGAAGTAATTAGEPATGTGATTVRPRSTPARPGMRSTVEPSTRRTVPPRTTETPPE